MRKLTSYPKAPTTQHTRTLSASGSRYDPSTELVCQRLATAPSSQSVMAAMVMAAKAVLQLWLMMSADMNGPDASLARDREFGRLQTSFHVHPASAQS